VDKRKDRTVQ